MVLQGDKQMARTTKQTKTPATPGFAIEIKDNTELGLAILVAVYAGGGYRPVGVALSISEAARSRRATGATTPAPPSKSTSCVRRVWKATTSGWRPRSAIEERDRGRQGAFHPRRTTMTTFMIDTDNNITAHSVTPAAQDTLTAFDSQKELSKTTAEWPISRLVETWNSFAGAPPFGDLKPVKRFENRAKATAGIWMAIQKLEAAPAPPAAPKPAKKAKGGKAAKAAAGAPTPAPDAHTPRVPREFSKKAIRARHAAPHRRRHIAGNYGRDGLAKTYRQGLHQHPPRRAASTLPPPPRAWLRCV
jgi:hypothetical protein